MSFSIILLAFASMLIVGGLAFSQAASAAPAAASSGRACEAELSRAGIERMQRQAGSAGREAIACLARSESSSRAAIEPQEKAARASNPAQPAAREPQLGRD